MCVDICRERCRHAISVEKIEEIDMHTSCTSIFEVDSPESAILRAELREYIYQMISALSERLRIPFVLRFLKQLSPQEIAQKLSISVDSVYKRIQQAREILQRRLRTYLLEGNNTKLQKVSNSCFETPKFSSLTAEQSSREQLFTEKICYQVTAICLESPFPV
ncbi:MAG: RNA polymerase sigma factor [Leptolyngbya sp. SIO4C1]|nr:RNA polymerase sigma factor [Leptolyngbya sp. SIO4C1]